MRNIGIDTRMRFREVTHNSSSQMAVIQPRQGNKICRQMSRGMLEYPINSCDFEHFPGFLTHPRCNDRFAYCYSYIHISS